MSCVLRLFLEEKEKEKRKKMETPNETKASPGNNLRSRGAVGNNSKKDMIFRADKIDLKNLDIQLEKHLSRVWSRSIEKSPKPKEEWEIELAKLEMRNVIARGAYGIVYKGIYDGQDVAGPKTQTQLLFLLAMFPKCDHSSYSFSDLFLNIYIFYASA